MESRLKVILLTYTSDPEKIVAIAARMCYSSLNTKKLIHYIEKMGYDGIRRFLVKILSKGHESPFEHITYRFSIEGISRACSHQLVRHRIANCS